MKKEKSAEGILNTLKRSDKSTLLKNYPDYKQSLSDLLEFAPDAFFHGDSKGNIIAVNRKAVDLTGFSKADLLKMNISEIFDPSVLKSNPLRYDLLKSGRSIKTERDIIRKDAKKVPVEMNSRAMPDGTYQSFIRDNTARKIAEEALSASSAEWQSTFDALNDAVILIDSDQRILLYNRSMKELFGNKRKSLKGKYCYKVVHGTKAALTMCPINKMKLTHKRESIELEIGGKWFEVIVDPIKNNGTNSAAAVHILRDITQYKHAEERLISINKELKELNATKDKLFSIVAHDLRSPFNSIMGYSQLLRENIEEYPLEKSAEFAKYISSSSRQVMNLLDNLLDWARNQTGQIEFKPTEISLSSVVAEVIAVTESTAEIKNISLNIDIDKSIIVYADQNMLRAVFRNLIGNAIKFSRTGGSVEIGVVKGKKHILVTVSDNGVGMDKQTLNRLFKNDEIYSSPGTANEKGSGLGLIICKDFISRHGGEITVLSQLDKGSRFIFSLPAKKSA